MSRIKTVEYPEQIRGELRVLRKLSEYEFGVELWCLRDGKNNNNWDYRNLDKHYQTFLGTPILCAYVGASVGDGHNMREKRNPRTGETYYSFTDATAERIVGTISDDPKDLTLKERDGHTWIVAKGRLWRFYAPELVDKIVRTGRMDVSVETEIKTAERDGDVEVYTDWVGLGVTILGDHVDPAVPGAHIAKLAAMQEEFRSLKLRAAALSCKSQPQTKCKGVKNGMNKQTAARLAPQFEGYKIVGLSADEMNVILVDADGRTYAYTFNADDNGHVILDKVKPACLSVSYAFSEDTEPVGVDLADITEYVAANAADVDILRSQLETARDTIKTMQDAEHKRRVNAVKEAVSRKLEEIKESESVCMDTEAAEIAADAEAYAEIEENGEWCGEEKACNALLAKCMAKRLEAERVNKEKKRAMFAWNNDDEPPAVDGIGGILELINE